jgi:hypothetical protein
MHLKLYVWKDVLWQWTSGIIFALAESEEQARQVVLNADEGDGYYDQILFAINETSPNVYDVPIGFYLPGGA